MFANWLRLNRNTLLICLVTIGICGALTLRSRSVSKPAADLTAQSITLVNDAGHEVANLSSPQGNPQFVLYDAQHRKRTALFLESNGTPDLYLYDSSETERAALNLFDSGVPNLAYMNGETGAMAISSSPASGAYDIVFEEATNGRRLGALEFSVVDGTPRLRLLDGNKRIVWQSR